MAFKDALVCLPTYPDAASTEMVDEAAVLCAGLAASVAVVAPEVRFTYSTHPLAEALLHIGQMARAIEGQSSEAAAAIAARFEEKARGHGIYGGAFMARGETHELPDMAAQLARTRDLCVVPCGPHGAGRVTAEAVVFGSGRPVLIYPPGKVGEAFHPARIQVAWDGGRAAARAVADAIPLLKFAEVELVTVVGEKATAEAGSAEAMARHLSRHGIDAKLHEVKAVRRSAEEQIIERARETGADLLVMGAFGRSSLREFVLGGVTDSILQNPPMPVFLAH